MVADAFCARCCFRMPPRLNTGMPPNKKAGEEKGSIAMCRCGEAMAVAGAPDVFVFFREYKLDF